MTLENSDSISLSFTLTLDKFAVPFYINNFVAARRLVKEVLGPLYGNPNARRSYFKDIISIFILTYLNILNILLEGITSLRVTFTVSITFSAIAYRLLTI